MTPQPQQEYLINEVLINAIGEWHKGPHDITKILSLLRSRPAPSPPTEYFITHDINCGEYSSTIAVASPEKPIQIDDQTVKVGGITIRFDSEIESIETIDEYGESLRTGGEPR